MSEEIKKGEVVIYKAAEGPQLQVRMDGETVWMTQAQIASLFSTDRTSIGRHIRNVIKTAELNEKSVCAIFAHTAQDGKTYRVKYYNLDMIISVGYRVNSKKATLFRQWATEKIRDLVIKGYSVYEQRLAQFKDRHNAEMKELQQTVRLFQNVIEAQKAQGYEKELLNIIVDYANAWTVLHGYDEGRLKIEGVSNKPARRLEHQEILKSVGRFKKRLVDKNQASGLFGQEVGGKFEAVLGSIYQTYAGRELYRSLEEKAAHLFYFAIKDHPFVDGNKRIASLVFLLFLIENNYLINKKGERKVNDTALVALALLIAESRPAQKDAMIKLIVNLINRR
ncbi:MAG: virulence protein RhuM/Fic/DOC family protein [Patescibacteria group bacterium]|nr:virulence protein RhuM/Fic/DOC family protein [Patescibacteria group bacterium]